uniref:Putative ovule protein n=1 Tax=Solanum chacoense TaxID=4108 RepID=A0A0V0H4U5_SOLCH
MDLYKKVNLIRQENMELCKKVSMYITKSFHMLQDQLFPFVFLYQVKEGTILLRTLANCFYIVLNYRYMEIEMQME